MERVSAHIRLALLAGSPISIMPYLATLAPAPPARVQAAPGDAALADLTWLNIADMLSAFGLRPGVPLRSLAELACRWPARRFARQMLELDARVAAEGLAAGGAWICGRLSQGLELRGPPPPARGPLLVVANHPGLLDAAALFAAIPRNDLRVLAITRPFLRALPGIAAHLIPVGTTPAARTAALRMAARHLRSGGALLSFPAGRIEPDPLRLPGAAASVAHWSTSVDTLARLADKVTVLPAIVGGVLAPGALRHPLLRLRRTPADRQWLAAILQLAVPRLRRTVVRVQLGTPIVASGGPLSVAVAAEARRLIREVARP
ncbi:MAG: 1-acyl-sn-glycerol-3-phosphate acyltransferase [Chloroflexi bacterium OHK40]